MSQVSPILALPFLQPSQAQKHVTHNEALRRLDIITQLRVRRFGATTPPSTPDPGVVYALGPDPDGAWAGQGGHLAAWLDGSWHFVIPQPGWRAWGLNEQVLRIWDGAAWKAPPGPQPTALADVTQVGVGTTADEVNRLSVRSPATLLSHEGTDHRVKINKATTGDTASLMFQSGWTGHAELGLTGGTALSVKVSADGQGWTEALRLDPASGLADGAAVQSAPTDVTPGRLMRADYGYGPGNLLGPVSRAGGQPTGAVIERGDGAEGEYVRFADGTQICTRTIPTRSVSAETVLNGFHRSEISTFGFARNFSSAPSCALSRATPGTGGLIADVGYAAGTGWEVRFMAPVAFSNVMTGGFTLLAVGRWV